MDESLCQVGLFTHRVSTPYHCLWDPSCPKCGTSVLAFHSLATGGLVLALCSRAVRTTASTRDPTREVTCVCIAGSLVNFLIFQGSQGMEAF